MTASMVTNPLALVPIKYPPPTALFSRNTPLNLTFFADPGGSNVPVKAPFAAVTLIVSVDPSQAVTLFALLNVTVLVIAPVRFPPPNVTFALQVVSRTGRIELPGAGAVNFEPNSVTSVLKPNG